MSTSTWLISPAALHARLGSPGLVIFDATVDLPAPRFDGDYRVTSGYVGWLRGHLPGARHADLLVDLAAPNAGYSFAMPTVQGFAEHLARLGVGPRSEVVVYDRADGFWAARLWWMLHSVGLGAALLDGGYQAWQRAGLAIGTGVASLAPASAPPVLRPRAECWASLEEVHAISLGQAPGRLVCALAQAVFDGSAATRYSRRGHIPGSLNRPARTLFESDGRYRPTSALAQVLGPDLLGDGSRLVLYCGGGISAAATAFALTLLGRENVALYDGSLQQWSADPALPMTTGAAPA
ncbi:rhodanese-like domain-containing protein [Pseudomonas sp. RIT-PI-S]|uniref:sulfurtransferase n=1 Tax=Pseudomonas sp. RIT-PI-S TaxID=3035295 RepID=UPI0021D88A54|nr:rhodanese-like domain-containing protein [Pseudomonas sp. RIT-PI-S]